ncbi:uncharacterized protein LOC116939544 [Petromyzon marinus]|uniref:uncharacterized protein LOC116939544 n=1 Tax=Petromyzon marinus TaxID=7757 RepID=UPI003F71216C
MEHPCGTEGTEWDTDLEDDGDESLLRPGGPRSQDLGWGPRYREGCHTAGVCPATGVLGSGGFRPQLRLAHRALGPRGAAPLARCLTVNTVVTKLDLSDNWLQEEGCRHLSRMLKENCYIEELNVSSNRMGVGGAMALCSALRENSTITSLNLSGNNLTDEAARHLHNAMSVNRSLKELDMSHNRIGDAGAMHVAHMIANSETLETLDLAWSLWRWNGSVAIAAAISVNRSVRWLSLAWTGVGIEGALALREALQRNRTLHHLDLSSCRVDERGARALAAGLQTNVALRSLKLALNPIMAEGALALLSAIQKNKRSTMQDLNISNVVVNEQFVQLLSAMRAERPRAMHVRHGGVGSGLRRTFQPRVSPMQAIQGHLLKNKLRLWDFFRNMDKSGTMSVTQDVFRSAMQQLSTPLEEQALEELISALDRDGSGWINYRELLDGQRAFRRTARRASRRSDARSLRENRIVAEFTRCAMSMERGARYVSSV